jgi:hypothetical protein
MKKTYCDQCQRQFKSHLSLVMHHLNSPEHMNPDRKAEWLKRHPPKKEPGDDKNQTKLEAFIK